ncbi:hypothetical protein D3C84_832920 [compost metagenome]
MRAYQTNVVHQPIKFVRPGQVRQDFLSQRSVAQIQRKQNAGECQVRRSGNPDYPVARTIQVLGHCAANAFAGASDEKGTTGHFTLLEKYAAAQAAFDRLAANRIQLRLRLRTLSVIRVDLGVTSHAE